MKETVSAITLLASILVFGAGALVFASEEHSEATVRGEILDMACYMAHEARGEKHAACALKCIKEGQPMGLLAEDGTLYLLYAGHKDASGYEKAKDLVGKSVVITGKHVSRGGLNGIEVSAVKSS